MKGLIVADREQDRPPGVGWAPRCAALAPVANRPLLARAVETLLIAGSDAVAVVCDAQTAPRLRSALEGEVDERVEWVTVQRGCDVPGAILAAEDFIAGDRFVVHTTDGLWLRRRPVLSRAIADLGPNLDALLFLRPQHGRATPRRPAPVRHDAGGHRGVVALTESLGGIHAFGPRMLSALRALPASSPRSLVDAVELLLEDGGRVRTAVAQGWSCYGGHTKDLLAVNRTALDAMEEPAIGGDPEASEIDGRVRIDLTAHVESSVVRGPVVIGAHARIVDAYLGPYTVVGEATVIENSEVEASVVLTGARIQNLGVRLEGSVIGQGARVGRTFALPKALRLWIGDDARVDLC